MDDERTADKLPAEYKSTVALTQPPILIVRAGKTTTRRFFEFFTANIRNRNTREAYQRALIDLFA